MAKVIGVRYLGKEDTYNMEVEGHHNFSVCGGLIVHNSYDSSGMGLQTWHSGVSIMSKKEEKGIIAEHKDKLARGSRRAKLLS